MPPVAPRRLEVNLQPIVWQTWNGTYYTTTTTTPILLNQQNLQVYSNWQVIQPWTQTTTTTSINWEQPWTVYNARYEETAAQRAARERAAREQRARQEAASARFAVYERERAAADELARNLLLACLNADQAADFLERKRFDVLSSRGRRFRIKCGGGQAGNVALLDGNGQEEAHYCVHPPDGLPHADAWLAQKLALEADEDTVMAVANMPWSRAGHRDIRPAARRTLRLAA